jgi:hypothetical protein
MDARNVRFTKVEQYLWCSSLTSNSKIPPQPSITGCDGAVDPVLRTVRWIIFG